MRGKKRAPRLLRRGRYVRETAERGAGRNGRGVDLGARKTRRTAIFEKHAPARPTILRAGCGNPKSRLTRGHAMKSLLSVCIIAVVCAAPAARSQDKGHPPDEPGPIHKELAKRAGEYNIVSKFALKPGESPMESTG